MSIPTNLLAIKNYRHNNCMYPTDRLYPMLWPPVKIEDLEDEFIQADCWGIEINKRNGKSIRLYDNYDTTCCRRWDWWHNRNRSLDKAISLTEVGDTIVIYMFIDSGFNVRATRTESDWKFEYLATLEYLRLRNA
jgi:hypothetical protein